MIRQKTTNTQKTSNQEILRMFEKIEKRLSSAIPVKIISEDVLGGKIAFATTSRASNEFHLGHIRMVNNVGSINSVNGGLPVIQAERKVFIQKVGALVGER